MSVTADSPVTEPESAESAPSHPAETATAASYGVLRWLVLATFVVILNETIMVNAIPRLMEEFAVGARSAQWLSTAFMLTMAVVIPITGWFLQRVSTRTAFAAAMAVFCTGTLLAALAPVFWLLVAGRVVQAAGTAVMMPLLMTTLMTVVPQHDRGRVMGNVTLAISVAPALGPTVSGVVLQVADWRWLFGVVLPVAASVGILGLRRLVDIGEPRAMAIDWASVLLAAVGFGGLVYGLSQLGTSQPTAVPPAALVVGGIAVVTGFVLRQLALQRSGTPLLDLRALTHTTFTLSLTLQSVAFLAMLGSMILLPLYLQELRGLEPLETGLLVMPGGLAMGLLGPRIGRLFDRYGGRPLVVPGSVGVVVALGALSQVGAATSYAVILGAHLLLMVSLAALFTPAFTLGLGALPPHLYSHGSSLLGTAQQVAAAIGTAVSVTVLSSRAVSLAADGASTSEAFVGGLRLAFGVSAVLALGIVVLAVLLPSRLPENGDAAGAHDA